MLLGLEQVQDGKVLIDGVDVTELDRVHCFSTIGQESDLFRGLTLVDNVKYATDSPLDSQISNRALTSAAEDAQLESVVSRLQGGWSASVGPRGRLLSGGERQRVCLARALYREEVGSGILLMDEATSSLDARTENLVSQAIMKRVRLGATAVIVAHRLTSVQNCDVIIVLRDGRVVGHGTHEELLQAGGWYAEAWRLQSESRQLASLENVD